MSVIVRGPKNVSRLRKFVGTVDNDVSRNVWEEVVDASHRVLLPCKSDPSLSPRPDPRPVYRQRIC